MSSMIRLKIWNIINEEASYARAKLTHNDAITCLTLSADGKFALTGSHDNSLKLWEVSTGYLTQVWI